MNKRRFGVYLIPNPPNRLGINVEAKMHAVIINTNFPLNFSEKGLKIALPLSKLIDSNIHGVLYIRNGNIWTILQAVSPRGQISRHKSLNIAKLGIQIAETKSTMARTTTNLEPGRSDTSPNANFFTTKALPIVPIIMVSE